LGFLPWLAFFFALSLRFTVRFDTGDILGGAASLCRREPLGGNRPVSMKVAWILRDGDVVASAEVADTLADRTKGLIGKAEYEGAMLLPRTRSIHTVGVRFPLDVGFLDGNLVVLDTVRVERWRVALPRRRARSVLEASAGSFERWGLRVGDRLELREIP
jgi:uncharacterized membrane protein (UPF0127 family)